MTATDDYPKLARLAQTDYVMELDAGVEANLALKEIDRLRESCAFQRSILDDVLPTVYLNSDTIVRIDNRWVLVKHGTPPPAEPLQARATVT